MLLCLSCWCNTIESKAHAGVANEFTVNSAFHNNESDIAFRYCAQDCVCTALSFPCFQYIRTCTGSPTLVGRWGHENITLCS